MFLHQPSAFNGRGTLLLLFELGMLTSEGHDLLFSILFSTDYYKLKETLGGRHKIVGFTSFRWFFAMTTECLNPMTRSEIADSFASEREMETFSSRYHWSKCSPGRLRPSSTNLNSSSSVLKGCNWSWGLFEFSIKHPQSTRLSKSKNLPIAKSHSKLSKFSVSLWWLVQVTPKWAFPWSLGLTHERLERPHA